MKFYYIDDSMLHQNTFSEQIRTRFLRLFKENEGAILFISAENTKSDELENFISSLKDIPIYVNPIHFDVLGVCGMVYGSYLEVEGYPTMQSFSGSCVAYDTQTHTCQRIYLGLFLNHKLPELDLLIDDLEDILEEQLNSIGKKNTFIN